MDEQQHSSHEDSYTTGSTRPPRQHKGLLAVLLVLVILLSGISCGLGLLNIRLSFQLGNTGDQSLNFLPPESQDPSASSDKAPGAVTPPENSNAQLQLQPSPESPENIPQTGGLSLQEIYARNIDSVVSISCTLSSGSTSGTGVIFSQNGYIVTNAHVIENARSISVRLTNEMAYPASVVGADTLSDLAVLYISAEGLNAAAFGDSDALRVGDAVAAIGDPLGVDFRGTLTDGIVSAINREVSVSGYPMTLIQTNAALNSGNSGGPLINCHGQVIGINTMKISAFVDSAGVEGLGFAIPSTTVKQIVDQLVQQGYVSGRPTLGIQCQAVPESYQLYYRLPAGCYITQVQTGSSAHKAGLAAGDILLAVGDTRVTSPTELTAALGTCAPGQSVTLTIYRNYRQYTVSLVPDTSGG